MCFLTFRKLKLNLRIKHEIQSREGRVPEQRWQQTAREAPDALSVVDTAHCIRHAAVAVHPALGGRMGGYWCAQRGDGY